MLQVDDNISRKSSLRSKPYVKKVSIRSQAESMKSMSPGKIDRV